MGFRNKSQKHKRHYYHYRKTHKKKIIKAGETPNPSVEDSLSCEVVQNSKLTIYKHKVNTVKEDIANIGNIQTKILYIIPKNVLIESVETIQQPLFEVFVNNSNISSKIKIEHRYINCFVYLCGEWYALMRLPERLHRPAIIDDKTFYKLKHISVDIDMQNGENGTGRIIIPDNTYTYKKGWLSSGKFSLTPDSYVVITPNHSVFAPLYYFRLKKVGYNIGKRLAVFAALKLLKEVV